MSNTILSLEQIKSVAPSVFATAPHNKLSSRYTFLPTIDVVQELQAHGFSPVSVKQSRSKSPEGSLTTAHEIRFRHADYLGPIADKTPEVVLTNSHDGGTRFRLTAGLYRLVCSNGLVVCDMDLGAVIVRHTGNEDTRKRILESTFQVAEFAGRALRKANEWEQIPVTVEQQLAIAARAVELKGNVNVKPAQLLESRRVADDADEEGARNLWVAFNTIQENLVRGGLGYVAPSGRRTATRAIKSVIANNAINSSLWQIAAEYAAAV